MRVEASATSTAPASVLYGLLKDVASWPRWSPMDAAELDRPGTDEPYGVGSVRRLTSGRVVGRDEVVTLVPDRRFEYRHTSTLPLRDYLGVVELEPTAEGTTVRWTSTFTPARRGTGWFWRLAIRRLVSRCATGLAGYGADQVTARPRP